MSGLIYREGLKNRWIYPKMGGWVRRKGTKFTKKTWLQNVLQVILSHFRKTFFHVWECPPQCPPLWALSALPPYGLLVPPLQKNRFLVLPSLNCQHYSPSGKRCQWAFWMLCVLQMLDHRLNLMKIFEAIFIWNGKKFLQLAKLDSQFGHIVF